MQISNETKLREAFPATATGTGSVDGATVDTQGYEGVRFFAAFGTPAADNTLKAQQGAQPDLSDAADLEGTQVTVGAGDGLVWLDIYRPRKRFIRAVATRGTGTTIAWGGYELYGARSRFVNNNEPGVTAGELHVSPGEGAA